MLFLLSWALKSEHMYQSSVTDKGFYNGTNTTWPRSKSSILIEIDSDTNMVCLTNINKICPTSLVYFFVWGKYLM